MPETTTLEQQVAFPASPEIVYKAYTDPLEQTRFTGAEATGQPKVGNRFTAWDGYIEGTYLELIPGQKIVQAWQTTEWPDGYPPSLVEITLRAVPEGTELTLRHTAVPHSQADDYDAGWHSSYWQPLLVHLEHA